MYKRMNVCNYICKCVCMYVYYMNESRSTYEYICTNVRMSPYMHACTCACVSICICIQSLALTRPNYKIFISFHALSNFNHKAEYINITYNKYCHECFVMNNLLLFTVN